MCLPPSSQQKSPMRYTRGRDTSYAPSQFSTVRPVIRPKCESSETRIALYVSTVVTIKIAVLSTLLLKTSVPSIAIFPIFDIRRGALIYDAVLWFLVVMLTCASPGKVSTWTIFASFYWSFVMGIGIGVCEGARGRGSVERHRIEHFRSPPGLLVSSIHH